jgi:MFS family permease
VGDVEFRLAVQIVRISGHRIQLPAPLVTRSQYDPDFNDKARPIKARNFRLFWTGESISEVGNSVIIVVIPLVAIDVLHTSTFIVTLLTAMVWLPWVIIGIPAGAWVDRLPPRPVMLASDAISVAVYASVPVVAWCGVLTVAQLIAVTLIAGAATVFFNSACRGARPRMASRLCIHEPLLSPAQNVRLIGRAADL